MARIGKRVDLQEAIYALDKNRGYVRIPTVEGDFIILQCLKHTNRYAYDHHVFEMIVGNKKVRINKDEFLGGLQYV